MNRATRSVIVVGAGIFGVTAALELRRRGYAVSLFDPGPLPHRDASSTSSSRLLWAASSPMPWSGNRIPTRPASPGGRVESWRRRTRGMKDSLV